jgi:hypothetical protein
MGFILLAVELLSVSIFTIIFVTIVLYVCQRLKQPAFSPSIGINVANLFFRWWKTELETTSPEQLDYNIL